MDIEDYLKEVEAREKEATKGPWESVDDANDYWGMVQTDGPKIKVKGFTIATDLTPGQGRAVRADRDFITASRQDIPRLLRMFKKLRFALGNIRKGCAFPENDFQKAICRVSDEALEYSWEE